MDNNHSQDGPEGVQADHNSMAIGGGIEIQGVQHSNIHIGNIIYSNAPTEVESPDREETIEVRHFEPETVLIPEGPFWMGSAPGEGIPVHETPAFEIELPLYRIGKYPVTNGQYEEFIRDTLRSVAPEMGWDGQRVPSGTERLPVSAVTWYDALAYCEWLSKKTGRLYTLPNEAQWEKACRARQNVFYPWGDALETARSNQGAADLAPVDAYSAQNAWGCFDLVGNVRQWTCTLWGEKQVVPDPRYAYPWKSDGRNDVSASRQVRRVVRGSAYREDSKRLRCSARTSQSPEQVGIPGMRNSFRVVMIV